MLQKKETNQSQLDARKCLAEKMNDYPNPKVNRNSSRREMMESKPRKVFIIGNSQLRKINGETLSRDCYSITVKPIPGAILVSMKNAKIKEDTKCTACSCRNLHHTEAKTSREPGRRNCVYSM